MVRLVDRVAYINHDIDDALRAGIIAAEDLPAAEIELLGPTGAKRIDTLARTSSSESREAGDIVQSEEIGEAMLVLRQVHVRAGLPGRRGAERARAGAPHAAGPVRPLHRASRGGPGGAAAGADEIQRITDYIAGMTDRFCIATFKRLALPEESRL